MAKFVPWSAKLQDRPSQTRTFTFDGGEVVLTLRRLTIPESYRAYDEAQECIDQHLPNEDDDNDYGPLPAIDGQIIEVSESLFRNCAVLAKQQPPWVKAEDRYTIRDLCGVSATVPPKVWKAVLEFSKEVEGKKKEEDQKNDSGADVLPSSAPPSNTTDNTTS